MSAGFAKICDKIDDVIVSALKCYYLDIKEKINESITSLFSLSRFKTLKMALSVIALQKQPPRGFLKKRCSENMQKIYRRTPIPKCDF